MRNPNAACEVRLKTIRTVLFLTMAFFSLGVLPAQALEVEVEASSVRLDFGLPDGPENLLDGDPTTAWVGGGLSTGVGQWVELRFNVPTRLERIGITNGHGGDGRFDDFRRIRAGRFIYPDESETKFWLRDEPGEQVVRLQGKAVKWVRLVVDEVFPRYGEGEGKKLAVSELKLYLSHIANLENLEVMRASPVHIPEPPPVDETRKTEDGIVELLREFYVRHTSLDPDYAELFAEDVRDRNDFRFEVFKEMQRQMGVFRTLRTARVTTEGLGFETVERQGPYARVRVFGSYRVKVAHLDRNLEEDSEFVVRETADGWKIISVEGEEDLF